MLKDNNSLFNCLTEDKGIQKRILKEGTGEIIKKNYEAIIHYYVKQNNKIIDQSESNCFLVIGDENEERGLNITISSMKKNEKSEFLIKPEYRFREYHYINKVNPNDILIYEIELLEINFPNKKLNDLSINEKIEKAKKIKEEGIIKYKEKKYEESFKKFDLALSFIGNIPLHKEESEERINLIISIANNLCNCCNHLENYQRIISTTNIGIKVKKDNPKLYYFRTLAFLKLDNLRDAEINFNYLISLVNQNDPGIKFIKDLFKEKEKKLDLTKKKISKNVLNTLYEEKIDQIEPPNEKIKNNLNSYVYFDIKIGEKKPKKIIFELFNKEAPFTSENFLKLCKGENDYNYSYKGSKIFKIIKNFIIQGGDFEFNNGKGGKSIFNNNRKKRDKKYIFGHFREGLLSLVNNNEDFDIGSQFYITLRDTNILDGSHIVFGRVFQGIDVLKDIENVEVDDKDFPKEDVIIFDCGEVKDE